MPAWTNYSRRWGDRVAVVAKPIAHVIDKVVGTKLEKCGGCDKRQEKLNELGRRVMADNRRR